LIAKSNEDLEISLKTVKYRINAIRYYTSNKSNSHYLLPFEEYVNLNLNLNLNVTEEPILQYKKNEVPAESSVIERKYEKPVYGKTFICKPDIQNDIYHLYTSDNEYVGLAAIPDYKTSVMMNNLFRNIKENNDLDALEESDDEEEFENANIDKFVYLEKSHKMVCNFNNKFKKWVPIKIIE
jgi:hypothetical protein